MALDTPRRRPTARVARLPRELVERVREERALCRLLELALQPGHSWPALSAKASEAVRLIGELPGLEDASVAVYVRSRDTLDRLAGKGPRVGSPRIQLRDWPPDEPSWAAVSLRARATDAPQGGLLVAGHVAPPTSPGSAGGGGGLHRLAAALSVLLAVGPGGELGEARREQALELAADSLSVLAGALEALASGGAAALPLLRECSEALQSGSRIMRRLAASPRRTPAPVSLGSVRVLLAEADDVCRRVSAAMLATLGCQPCSVADEEEVFLRALGAPYDVILIDDALGAGELARRLHSTLPERRRPRVYALREPEALAEGGAAAQVAPELDGVLTRPLRLEELRGVIEHERSRDEARADDQVWVDRGFLADLRQTGARGDPDLVTEMIDLFREDAAGLLEALQGAWEAGQADAVRKQAHALKGACACVGALRLGATCLRIEEAVRAGDHDTLETLIDGLAPELAATEAALVDERQA